MCCWIGRVAGLLFITSSPTALAQLDCASISFARSTVTPDQIVQDYSDAVFKIDAAGEEGTGYLIDSERGYMVTAGHVVKEALEQNSNEIFASNRAVNRLQMRIQTHNPELASDYAILSAYEPSKVRDLPWLEIAVDNLHVATGLVSLSWGSRRDEPVPAKGNPSSARPLKNGLFEFSEGSHGKIPGDSGAPLINSRGQVVGTLARRINIQTTDYVSVARMQEALWQLPTTAIARRLHDDVTISDITAATLVEELRPTNSSVRNLDLTHWLTLIDNCDSSCRRYSKHYRCPIAPAFRDRGLAYFLDTVVEIVAGSADTARSRINAARIDISLNNLNAAKQRLGEAETNLRLALLHFEMENPGVIARRDCLRKNLNAEECSQIADSNALAALHRDLSLAAYLQLTMVDTEPTSSRLFNTALANAKDALRSTSDSDSLGPTYGILGDIYRLGRDPRKAAESYAAAYESGFKPEWVENNFRYVLDNLEYESSEEEEDYRWAGIEDFDFNPNELMLEQS